LAKRRPAVPAVVDRDRIEPITYDAEFGFRFV